MKKQFKVTMLLAVLILGIAGIVFASGTEIVLKFGKPVRSTYFQAAHTIVSPEVKSRLYSGKHEVFDDVREVKVNIPSGCSTMNFAASDGTYAAAIVYKDDGTAKGCEVAFSVKANGRELDQSDLQFGESGPWCNFYVCSE